MRRPLQSPVTSRRKPRTPHHTLRSSRWSPPRFGDEDLVAGSPRHHGLGNSDGNGPTSAQGLAAGSIFDDDWGDGFRTPLYHSPYRGASENLNGHHLEEGDEPDENEIYELFQFPELSINEKIQAIKERLGERVGEYWGILSRSAFTYSRISERCFTLQD